MTDELEVSRWEGEGGYSPEPDPLMLHFRMGNRTVSVRAVGPAITEIRDESVTR